MCEKILCLTVRVTKSITFWDMMPCSPLSVNRRFGGTYRLHLQGRRNKFSKKPAACLLAQRTTRRHIPDDDILITTTVKTSNPKCVRVKLPQNDESENYGNPRHDTV
jgi:hypothetical protein